MADIEYSIKDIVLEVDGVQITQLAEGGSTGITPDDSQKDSVVEALEGEVGWQKSPSTKASGTIEMLKSSPQVAHLIALAEAKKDVVVSIQSTNKAATGFSEISLNHAKIGYPETTVTRNMEAFAFPFDGFGYDFRT